MTVKPWYKPLPSIGWQKEVKDTVEIIDDKHLRYQELKEWYYTRRLPIIQDTYNRHLEVRAPDFILEHWYERATSTFEQWLESKRQALRDAKEDMKKGQEFVRNNPPKEDIVNLIYEKFDKWYEKYKDDYYSLYDFEHKFEDAWYWGGIAPGSEPEFYEVLLSEYNNAQIHWDPYYPIFAVCRSKVLNRLKEIAPENWEQDTHVDDEQLRIDKLIEEFVDKEA